MGNLVQLYFQKLYTKKQFTFKFSHQHKFFIERKATAIIFIRKKILSLNCRVQDNFLSLKKISTELGVDLYNRAKILWLQLLRCGF